MNHVKRSIVIPVEMADMLDHLSKRYDASFTAMLRRIVREWAGWRKGEGYVVLPVSKPERRMMKKLFTEKGMSFRLGVLQALRRGLEQFSQKNDC
jgi:hypothetical protein